MLLWLILRRIAQRWKLSTSKFSKRLKNSDNTTKSRIVSELLEVQQNHPNLELKLLGKSCERLRQSASLKYDFFDRSQSQRSYFGFLWRDRIARLVGYRPDSVCHIRRNELGATLIGIRCIIEV
jgi:hypothetical protein